jgi:S-adenosylmethionine decarboxylase
MSKMGKHLLINFYDVSFYLLNHRKNLEKIMISAVEDEGMEILNVFSHSFPVQGVTVNISLAESHFSLHTWPEKGCAAVDIFTCGSSSPKKVANELIYYFDTDDYKIRTINR